MDSLVLKTPQEEIDTINNKLKADNPFVEFRSVQVEMVNSGQYIGWELIKLFYEPRTYHLSGNEQRHLSNNNQNYSNSDTIYVSRDEVHNSLNALIGRREHSTVIDISKQLTEALTSFNELKAKNEKDIKEFSKTIDELNRDISNKKDIILRSDKNIQELRNDINNLESLNKNYEFDMGKLRKFFGEKQLSEALNHEENK